MKSSLMCSVCGKLLKSKAKFNNHIKSSCGTLKIYMCKICDEKLSTPGSLHNHMLRHDKGKNFLCLYCAKQFVTKGQLKVHERIHTGDRAYVCATCGKAFCHRQSLVTHSTLHTGIKPFQCEGCGDMFSCITNLSKHRKSRPDTCGLIAQTIHRVNNPITKIKVKLNTPETTKLRKIQSLGNSEDKRNTELIKGNIKKTVENVIGCDQDVIISIENLSNTNIVTKADQNEDCGRKCLTEKYVSGNFRQTKRPVEYREQNLKEKTPHSSEIGYKCPICSTSFKTVLECKQHKVTAHSEIFTCKDCNKIFANADSLRSHQLVIHQGVSKKEYFYICPKCGIKFRQKAHLVIHEEKSCTKQLFKCDICNKHYSSKYTLRQHMKLHSDEKSHLCNFCGKKFNWKGQLKIHERSHTRERPYTCLFCPKTFSYRDSLITHSTIHTGLKPHFCKCCGSRFSCIANLAKHKQTHVSCSDYYKLHVNGEKQ